MARPISFEQAKARYVNRYTMEHAPSWAHKLCDGKRYAPHYRTDREWYDNTKFYGESELAGKGYCYSTNQSWPLGLFLCD